MCCFFYICQIPVIQWRLISLSIIFFRSIYIAANGRILFFFMAVCYSIVNMYHIFIYLSVDGCLGCFHILVIVNSVAVNTGVHISYQVSVFVFPGYMPRSGVAGSYDSCIFIFLRSLYTVFQSGCTSLHSHQQLIWVPLGSICLFLLWKTNPKYFAVIYIKECSVRVLF